MSLQRLNRLNLIKQIYLVILLWGAPVFSHQAQAYIADPLDNPAHAALSESVPTALTLNEFSTDDYELSWQGTPIEGVTLNWEKDTLQWVRVAEVLLIPRARIQVHAPSFQGGLITHAGYSHPIASGDSQSDTEISVALLSGHSHPIELNLVRNGQQLKGSVIIKFKPRVEIQNQNRLYFDPSCSRFGMSFDEIGRTGNDWTYIGCRLVSSKGAENWKSTLELLVLWDGVGERIQVSQSELRSAPPPIWSLRLSAEPGYFNLKSSDHEYKIRYYLSDRFYHLSLGAGAGLYSYNYTGPDQQIYNYAPELTLYASYFITEQMRVVGFDATVINSQLNSDLGLYLNTEYSKTLDRRLTVNVMLGIHAVGFSSMNQYFLKAGAPQGIEFILSDALKPGFNLSLGGFVYPSIDGKSYNNIWMRYGSSKVFGEVNFISWTERQDTSDYYSRSLGITLGFPIGRAF